MTVASVKTSALYWKTVVYPDYQFFEWLCGYGLVMLERHPDVIKRGIRTSKKTMRSPKRPWGVVNRGRKSLDSGL
jgi:hypothetical protein